MMRIKQALTRMFSDYSFDTDFSVADYTENTNDGRYSIAFNIMISSIKDKTITEPALISGTITVDPNTNDIALTYNKNIDTSML